MLVFVLLGFLTVAAPGYVAFTWIVDSTVMHLGTLFAEKQVLYDRFRGLEKLMREVALAETLAGSQSIRDWASDESNPELMRRGIAELEHFRRSFADRSYFFVIGASGNYYFNDAANSYAGHQYRYTVSAENPRDEWYFATAALGEGCHLNVDNDANLRVTKVWMNCVIREGRRVLGVLGTGIDLTAFIEEVVNVLQPGIVSIFVDRNGAVQAHRNQDMVDLRSLTAEMSAKRSVFSLVDSAADAARLQVLMAEVAEGRVNATSEFMMVGGKQTLVGVGYLDELGWFNVTFMDVNAIIDKRLFLPIAILLACLVGLVTLVIGVVFKRAVLDRLNRLQQAAAGVGTGDYAAVLALSDQPGDEIGRLSATFRDMAHAVTEHTRSLEDRVRERTEQLEQLAFRDGQTGLSNRRGFTEAFECGAGIQRRGLMLIDIDHFKSVNDNHGHAAGDAVVAEIARRIAATIAPGDTCARWGGDEFIVLINESAPELLRKKADEIMSNIHATPVALANGQSAQATVSVGACVVEPSEDLDMVVDLADAALYIAKGEGRSRMTFFEPTSTASRSSAA